MYVMELVLVVDRRRKRLERELADEVSIQL